MVIGHSLRDDWKSLICDAVSHKLGEPYHKNPIFSEKVEINDLHILRYCIILKQNDMLF